MFKFHRESVCAKSKWLTLTTDWLVSSFRDLGRPPLFTVRSFDLGKMGEEAAMTEDKIYVSIPVGAPTVAL